jgi:signal transduction histidine kinase
LATLHQYSARYSGRITVDSVAGQGTIFTVWLPVPTETSAPAAAPEPEPARVSAVCA